MDNKNHEHHTMVLETTYPTGAEEWHCPACGRRLIMTWPPAYKKIILEYGDEYAVHACTKGGTDFLSTQIGFELQKAPKSEDALAPWQDWMDNNNFESLWNN